MREMTLTTDTKEKIAVMQAAVDGATIQRTCGNGIWMTAWTQSWDWDSYEYRVKPEPLTLWVNVYPDRDYPYRSEIEADNALARHGRTVKMQEVPE